VDIGEHPRTSSEPLATKAKDADVDSVLIACCQGAEPFRAAAQALKVPLHTSEAAHKARCFLPTKDPAAANGKALRLLRGELRAATHRMIPEEIPLQIGKRVVLVTDLAEGLTLAESLHEAVALTVAVGPDLELPEDFPSRRANRGRLVAVDGRLGAFSTRIAAAGSERAFGSDQVVVALRNPPRIKSRTGLHILGPPTQGDWAAVPGALQDLIGDFMKPVAIRYDPDVCAGGMAGKEACGRCIPACPYQAIARDSANPLRVAVDHLACEACGACTAACPTSALSYLEPTAGELLNRIPGCSVKRRALRSLPWASCFTAAVRGGTCSIRPAPASSRCRHNCCRWKCPVCGTSPTH
jgi:ferredoxin